MVQKIRVSRSWTPAECDALYAAIMAEAQRVGPETERGHELRSLAHFLEVSRERTSFLEESRDGFREFLLTE